MQLKTVFERNIAAIKSNKVKYALLEHNIRADLSVLSTNGYNLAYEGEPLHNTTSPLGEAKYIFDSVENTNTSITIVYGIGLGYLFQYTARNAKGIVILYESNVDILKRSFELVDFSQELSKSNVFVATDKARLEDIIRNYYNENSYPEIICLPSYKKLFLKTFEADVERIKILVGTIAMDYNFTKNRFLSVASLILQNVPYLAKESPLNSIRNIYEGKTAVVCSAGPTLYENLETLKKYKDNVVIICVGTACRALVKAGITPDFVCIVEDRNVIRQVKDLDMSESALVLEPSTNINIHKYAVAAKKVFCHTSNNLPPNKVWAELSGEDTSEYTTRGSVSYCALNIARILGCKRLVAVGQDLAFLDGQLYSKDSAYRDLKIRKDEVSGNFQVYVDDIDSLASQILSTKDKGYIEEFVKNLLSQRNSRITSVRGINGEMLPTEAVYLTFVQCLVYFAQKYSEIEFINTSMRGAKIDGFRDIPLEDALINTTRIEKFDVAQVPAFSINIVEKLRSLISMLDGAMLKITESQKLLVRFRTEYVRHKQLTKEMLQIMKKIVANYVYLSIDYAQANSLFDFITKKEQMEFEAYLQRTRDIDINIALKLAELQTQYLDATIKNIEAVKLIINNDINELEGEAK